MPHPLERPLDLPDTKTHIDWKDREAEKRRKERAKRKRKKQKNVKENL